jgi:hypothetical protein
MRHPILFILLSLALISCGDKATGPVSETFSLEVQVRESSGAPVEGLTVATWNLSGSLHQLLQDYLSKRAGATAVDLTLPQASVCWLSSYDLEGHLVQSVLAGDTLFGGEYRLVLGPNGQATAGVEVNRYELIAKNVESGEELFRDAKYMTMAEIDHTQLETGTTDSNGRYVTQDRTIVPGLYDLPEMPALDGTGQPIGTFTLDDSLTIRIYDDQDQMMELRRAVTDARNAIQVIWDPQPASSLGVLDSPPRPNGTRSQNSALARQKSAVPQAFELSQNYPNPFN